MTYPYGAVRVARQRVVPDRADEDDPRSESGGRDRLVPALAARVTVEDRVADRLAGGGQVIDTRDEIDVHRPDDDDPTGHPRRRTIGSRPLTTPSTGSPPTARRTFAATRLKIRPIDWLVVAAA